jgi:hypothetical protein
LIKELEIILKFKINEVNNKKNIERFNEPVNISDDLKNMINRIFRTSKNENNFKYWYYQLILMYKHIFKKDIFDGIVCKINKINYYSYSLKSEFIKKFNIE